MTRKRGSALAAMAPAELRGEWLQTFKVPAPAVGPRLLHLALAYRLQEKASGGLLPSAAREIETLTNWGNLWFGRFCRLRD
jgi:hypothetical protein